MKKNNEERNDKVYTNTKENRMRMIQLKSKDLGI